MDGDSYEPTESVASTKRRRRPWWRWNLITLAGALFVLLWTRELANFSPGLTWLSALTLFFVWAAVPVPFTGGAFVPNAASQFGGQTRRRPFLWMCRAAAVVFFVASIGCFIFSVYYYLVELAPFSYRYRGSAWQMLLPTVVIFTWGFLSMVAVFATGAILWLLIEVVEKLDLLLSQREVAPPAQPAPHAVEFQSNDESEPWTDGDRS